MRTVFRHCRSMPGLRRAVDYQNPFDLFDLFAP
jgi:hypothetical protein